MTKQPEQIKSICQQNAVLAKLTQHAQLIEQLNHTLHQTLPLQFSAHCSVANIRHKALIIHTDNASFASLIRFQIPTLCKLFSTKLDIVITTIEIKVRPYIDTATSTKTRTHTAILPKSAASTLHQTAEAIDNEALSLSLEKLATRFRSK